MKKILQRIGLLAAAVMLLWGWQGMEAKADEPTFTFVHEDNSTQHISVDDLYVYQNEDGYYFDLYLETGYVFTQKPIVDLRVNGIIPETLRGELATGNKSCRYYINTSIDDTQKYEIVINNIVSCIKEVKEIAEIQITVIPPVVGEQLPSEWQITADGVAAGIEAELTWQKVVGAETVTGIAEPNTHYHATISLSTKEGYLLDSRVSVFPGNYKFRTKKDDNTKITCTYSFTTGDAQPSNPGNTNPEVTWEKWNDWTVNTDKLENGHIAKGYGLSGSAEESHKTHLFLYVEPDDGYYFTEEPKVSWNDTLLVPMPKDSYTLDGYKYQLDDNGSGTIVVEGKAVKKETNESTNEAETSAPSASDDSSEEPYKIINGAKSTWNGSTTEGLTIRGDGDFEKFAGVRVDGNWIPSVHYEAKAGSTIVTLKPSYLASLSEGEHTVDIMWIDDSASTTFNVAANTADTQSELDSVPKTGEGVMGWIPEVLLLIAAGALTVGVIIRKQSKNNL